MGDKRAEFRAWRRARGYSLLDLHRMTGISMNTIISWSCGRTFPSPDHQLKMWGRWNDFPMVERRRVPGWEQDDRAATVVCARAQAKLAEVEQHEIKLGRLMTSEEITSHVIGNYLPEV